MSNAPFKWVRSGYCIMCGECCNIHNFYGGVWDDNPDVKTDADGYCEWFDRETRKCNINKKKPIGCMRFPQHPNDIKSFPNCSYRFEKVYKK
jgi:Fe-S-cluster containining protein